MLLKPIKIGNLNLKTNIFIAPLAGYTNLPTRLIYRVQGAGIAYAEMVSALGLKFSFDKSAGLIDSNEKDSPLGVQFFGPDSESILTAFLKVKDYAFDLVDINCGCSVRKILKSNSGAALLKDPEEIYKVILNLKKNTDKPVTLKIRGGWDESSLNYMEVLDAAESSGADLITFHPRTRSMLFKGNADWSKIKEMKEKAKISVIGNGDIFNGNDAVRMMEETGCDGVMLARGLIENPFLIEEVKAALSRESYINPIIKRRINALLKHCQVMIEYFGEKKGIFEFRKFIRGYIKGLPEISKIRQLLNKVESYLEFEKTILEYLEYLVNKTNC